VRPRRVRESFPTKVRPPVLGSESIARALVIRTRVLLSKCAIQKYVVVRDRFIVLTRNLHH
jgi:hypothetical protein